MLICNVLFLADINDSRRKRKRSHAFKASRRGRLQRPALLYQSQQLPYGLFESDRAGNSSLEMCSMCRITLPFGISYQQHFLDVHSQETAGPSLANAEPFICEICNKGFISKERLRQHSSVHDSSYVSCYICDVKFKHKKNIKRHMESTHGLKKCPYCMALYKMGDDFNAHILNCDGSWRPTEAP